MTAFNVFLRYFAGISICLSPADAGIAPLRRRVLGETPVADPTWFCISRLKAGKTWQTIKSPGYPKKLEMKHSRCTWIIASPGKLKIRIAFRGIGLVAEDPDHCSSNYLEIIDGTLGKSQGRVCGRKTGGDIVSQGNRVRMDLQIDPSEEYQRGFSLSYMATKAKPGFYGMKSFNEKPLPPLKPPSPKEPKPKPGAAEKPKSKKPGKPMLTADGQLIMVADDFSQAKCPSGTCRSEDGNFKRLKGSSAPEQMSTLVIVGIVVGVAIGVLIVALIIRRVITNKKNMEEKKAEAMESKPGQTQNYVLQEKSGSIKRNILAPAVVIPPKDAFPNIPDKDFQDKELSSSSDEDTKNKRIHHQREGENISYNRPLKSQSTRKVTKETRTGKPDCPSQIRQLDSPRDLVTKKVPYRYNSRNSEKRDFSEAIEALNNETFCEERKKTLYGCETKPRGESVLLTRVFSQGGKQQHPSFMNSKQGRTKSQARGSLRRNFALPGNVRKVEEVDKRRPSGIVRTQQGSRCRTANLQAASSRKMKIHEQPKRPPSGCGLKSNRSSSKRKDPRNFYAIAQDVGIPNFWGNNGFNSQPSPSLPRHVVPSSRR